jgi:hypothetical protein
MAAEGGRITGFEPDQRIRKNRYFIKPPIAVAEFMPFSFIANRRADADSRSAARPVAVRACGERRCGLPARSPLA